MNRKLIALSLSLPLVWAVEARADHEATQLLQIAGVAAAVSCVTTTTSMVMGAGGGGGGDEMSSRLYLEHNAVQLARDLPRGEGPVVDDLAAQLGLDRAETGLLGRVLRKARTELLELARVDLLDTPRAALFMKRVTDLALAEPVLARRLQARSAPVAQR